MIKSRRVFAIYSASIIGTCLSGNLKAQAMLSEADPQAMALGYRENASYVDNAKYPKFTSDQGCYNCALYLGSQGSSNGGCPLFSGRNVSASGWCSAYARKAGSSPPSSQQSYNSQPLQPSYPAPQNTRTTSLTIDAAKGQCSDLGFKQGTEGFAKCVLQFTK